MTYKEIVNAAAEKYQAYDKTREYLDQRIEFRKEQIERLSKRQDKNWATVPKWPNEVIKPIAEMLLPEFPNRYYEILGPFGLCSTVSIHFYKNGVEDDKRFSDDNCISITFVPGTLKKGKLYVRDYTTKTGEYRVGTLGEINGMNYLDIPIPEDADIKWFMGFIESQNLEAA